MDTIQAPPQKVNPHYVAVSAHQRVMQKYSRLKCQFRRLKEKEARQQELLSLLASLRLHPDQDPSVLSKIKALMPRRGLIQ